MKQKFIYIILAVFFICVDVNADSISDVEFIQELYGMETSFEGQYQYLVDLAKQDFPGKVEFFSGALNRLLRTFAPLTPKSASETSAANNQAVLICKTLAALDAGGGAQYDIMRTTRTFSDAVVISEALIALGKLKAVNYYQSVLQNLINSTTQPALERPYHGERIAYGAIESLKYYGDIAAYIPIFLTLSSWYSEWVKQAAVEALNQLTRDPSEPLKKIIEDSSYSYYQKYIALEMAESSGMSAEKKSEIAMAAFSEGYYNKTATLRNQKELANLRKYSMTILRRLGTDDDRIYRFADLSYKTGTDTEEKMDALAILGSLKTEKSVDLLLAYLEEMNELVRQKKFAAYDEQMIRAIIMNLGNTGERKAAMMLQAVLRLDYSSQIQALAQANIKKITG